MKMYVKKIMCLLLAGVMLAGMLPMTAAADTGGTGSFSVQMLDTAENTEIRKNVGETVEIPVVVNHVDKDRTYNSFDMTFTYDASVLELVSDSISGMSVTGDSGTVRVLRYGADLEVGSAVFTLKFNVKNPGRTTIKTTEAQIGIKQTAQDEDASPATIVNSVTIVTNSTVTFDSNGGSSVDAQTVTYGEKLQKPADPIRKKYLFKGWYEDLNVEPAWDFDKNTVTKEALTLYAKWEQALFSVTAEIQDHEGNKYDGEVNVKLMRGNDLIASTTGSTGTFTFPEVDVGMYNLVAVYKDEDGEHTKTELINVDHDDTYILKLPAPGINSHLNVSDNAQTPSIMVGNLDEEANEQAKETAGDATVTIEMSIVGKTEAQVPAAVVSAVENKVGDDTTVEYLDISLEKTVISSEGTKTTTEMTETSTVLEIVIPYNGEGKTNLRVFRHHNGVLQEFANNTSREDQTFYYADGYIHLFTQKFSNYMISYDVSYKVTFDSNYDGGSTTTKTTGGDGKLASLADDPVRKNYVFKGWYTAKTGGTKVTTNTVFTADTTVYAQWDGYNVNVSNTSGGKVSVSHNEAAGGETVEITVTPNSGYQMKTLTVTYANGKNVTVLTDNNGKYSFVMPEGDVTVKVTFAAKSTSKADTSNPKTGDDFNLVAWNAAAVTSLMALVVLMLNKKKFCQK